MKALLVYPAHLPQTYYSFSGALPYIERRAALRRARLRVRRLPEEYRLLGALELQALRRRLDDLLPQSAAIPVPA